MYILVRLKNTPIFAIVQESDVFGDKIFGSTVQIRLIDRLFTAAVYLVTDDRKHAEEICRDLLHSQNEALLQRLKNQISRNETSELPSETGGNHLFIQSFMRELMKARKSLHRMEEILLENFGTENNVICQNGRTVKEHNRNEMRIDHAHSAMCSAACCSRTDSNDVVLNTSPNVTVPQNNCEGVFSNEQHSVRCSAGLKDNEGLSDILMHNIDAVMDRQFCSPKQACYQSGTENSDSTSTRELDKIPQTLWPFCKSEISADEQCNTSNMRRRTSGSGRCNKQETSEKRALRLEKQRLRKRRLLAAETGEQRATRLALNAQRARLRRLRETSEERSARLQKGALRARLRRSQRKALKKKQDTAA